MKQINVYSFAEKTPVIGSKVFVIDRGYISSNMSRCRVEGIIQEIDPKDGLPTGRTFVYNGEEIGENERLVILVGGQDFGKNPAAFWFDAEDIENLDK